MLFSRWHSTHRFVGGFTTRLHTLGIQSTYSNHVESATEKVQSYKHWTPHQSSKHIILPRVQKARRRLSLRCVVLKQTVAATVYIQCFPIVLHDDSKPATTTVEMDSQLLLLDDTYPTTLQYLHDCFQIKPWIQNANLLWGYGSKGSHVMSFRAIHRFTRESLRIIFPKLPVLALTDTWRYHEPAMWHLGKCGFAC